MPSYLNNEGRTLWESLLPELDYMNTVAAVDGHVLGLYCFAYGTFIEAEREIREQGAVVTVSKESTYRMPNPWVAIRNRAVDDMRRWGAELGVGAVSRSRIDVPKPAPAKLTKLQEIQAITRRR
jgi:P27 family predicted phage terminase small subunit